MRTLGIVVLVLAMAFTAPLCVMADEHAKEKASGDPITGAVKTVGKAAEGTVKTATSPLEALSRGEGDKMVSDPVKKGSETVAEATQDTGKTVTGQPVQ